MTIINVYRYRVSAEDLSRLEANPAVHLQSQEWRTRTAIRHSRMRAVSLLSRCLIRRLLANKMNIEATQVNIVTAPEGKPMGHEMPNLHFNVSHTEDQVLIALGSSSVGVDIESVKPRKNLDNIAHRIMHPQEWEFYQRLSPADKQSYFFDIWVLKEAFAKCDGRGIQIGFKNILTSSDPPGVVTPAGAKVWPLAAPAGYKAALVSFVEAQGVTVQQQRLASVFDV